MVDIEEWEDWGGRTEERDDQRNGRSEERQDWRGRIGEREDRGTAGTRNGRIREREDRSVGRFRGAVVWGMGGMGGMVANLGVLWNSGKGGSRLLTAWAIERTTPDWRRRGRTSLWPKMRYVYNIRQNRSTPQT